jgi:endonuclease-3
MDALLAMPGVGRKTANLVLIEAFDMDGICVDIHVHRISNRAGWLAAGLQEPAHAGKGRTNSRDPEETEMILRSTLPKKFWKTINPLLVLYGQNLCRPISPFCSRCVIKQFCARIGVEKSR